MKKSSFPYIVFLLINIAIALSCYFYPVSRDEFYYLEKINIQSPFTEYYNSYYFVNPRIGQFFANLISRNIVLEIVFGVLLFNIFISAFFLNIYRRFPDFRSVNDLRKFLWIAAFFIFFINYFGEMFYYTPYSTNYTLTNFFYLLYVFVIGNYYLDEKRIFLNKLPYLLLVIFGLFIGMGNEHVPPVLIAISLLLAFHHFIKVKKLPDFKLIILPFSVIIGYAFLYFAPANKIREAIAGKTVLDIGLNDYYINLLNVLKLYFYYNRELLVLVLIIILAIIVWNLKFKKIERLIEKIFFWALLFLLPLMIVAVSPMIGTRLLLFSNSILLIILYRLLLKLIAIKKIKISDRLLYGFLFLFFGMSIIMTYRANQNYEMVIKEIEQKQKYSKDVELDYHFNYFTPTLGIYLNRKIFLESGEDYIDKDASTDNSIEKNLKSHFQLHSIKEK